MLLSLASSFFFFFKDIKKNYSLLFFTNFTKPNKLINYLNTLKYVIYEVACTHETMKSIIETGTTAKLD